MTEALALGVPAPPALAARRPPRALLVAALLGPLLVVLPLGWTILEALGVRPAEAVELLFRPLLGELLLNTLSLIFATTFLAAVIGTGTAWCVERTDLPGRRIFAVLAAVPLAIPAFITSYAWVSISAGLQDFAGALLVVTASYTPLVYLPVAAALRSLDPALEESALALGQSPFRCFFRVVLPQLRPALLGGMLLVALSTLSEFGAFALMRFRTFTTAIYAEYRTGFNGPEASLLAMILVALCLVCLVAEAIVRGRARYGRVARGTRRAARRFPLGLGRWPLCAVFGALVVVTLGVPLATILFWLTQHGAAAIAPAAVSAELLVSSTLSSLTFGLAGAAVTMVLALPLGFLATRYEGRVVTLIERAAYLAQGMPGIVVALALVSLTIRGFRPLYQSAALLVIAYAILFLPLALVSVRAALVQAQKGLEESARALGLGWVGVTLRVILPMAGPGLGAAAAMVFVSIVTELTATLLLAPIGTQTLAVQVWADTSTVAFAAAAPYAALMAAISLLSTWVLARRFGAGFAAA